LGPQAELWTRAIRPDLQTMCIAEVEELRRSAHAFGAALVEVRRRGDLATHPFWGVWAPRSDPGFESELLQSLETLRDAAAAAQASILSLASELAVAPPISLPFIEAVRARVEHLDLLSPGAVCGGIAALATPDERRNLRDWIERVERYQADRRQLQSALPDAEMRDVVLQLPLPAIQFIAPATVRTQFRKHDKEVISLESARIAANVDARPVPEGTRSTLVRDLGDLALLEHEVRKQRRHIPIRQLVRRAGMALRAVKP